MRALLLLALLAQAAEAPVSIRVNPRVLFAGTTLHLTCRVPRAEENRSLEWGIEDYRTSVEQLNPGHRITNEWFIEHVPCGAGKPFCRLKRAGMKDVLVQASIEIRGCEEPGDPLEE